MGTKTRSHVVMLLVGVMLATSTARAQQAGPQPGSRTLATVAAEHAAKKQANRQTVLNVLERDEVRRVAKGAGLRIEKAAAAVATLEGAELAQVVEQAQRVEDAFAGGGKAMTALKWTLMITAILLMVGFLVGMAAMSAEASR